VSYDTLRVFKYEVLEAERDDFSKTKNQLGSKFLVDLLKDRLSDQDKLKIEKEYSHFFETLKEISDINDIINWQETSELKGAKKFFSHINILPNMPPMQSILSSVRLGYSEEELSMQGLGHRNLVLLFVLINSLPDGSMIQDRDPLTVASTRRNPVLVDVFNRLGYMERKGSGFGKIISGYEFQINYNESERPSFRSDRYQFTVVMPNLNYDVPQDFEGNETMPKSMSESMSEFERTIMQIILHYLDTSKEINSSIAAKLLKEEIKTASRLLSKAAKLDIPKSYGKTKNKVYFRG